MRGGLTAMILALGCPLVAFWLLRSEFFDAIWLTLPDAIFGIILTLGIPLKSRPKSLLLSGLALALVVGVMMNPRLTAMLMPVLMNSALALIFLLTIKAPEAPLITRIAQRARSPLAFPAELFIYTKALTLYWGLLFILFALNGLYWALTDQIAWVMLFANTINFFVMATFFVLEQVYRVFRFRHLTQTSPLEVLKVVLRDGWKV
jgi:uncharacterized membrane protein